MYHTRRSLSLRGHADTLCEVVRIQSAALRIYVKETVSRFVQQLGQMRHPELRDREQPGMDRQTADAPLHPLKSRAPIKAQTHGVSYQVVDPQRDAELTRQGIDMEAAGAQEPGVI